MLSDCVIICDPVGSGQAIYGDGGAGTNIPVTINGGVVLSPGSTVSDYFDDSFASPDTTNGVIVTWDGGTGPHDEGAAAGLATEPADATAE